MTTTQIKNASFYQQAAQAEPGNIRLIRTVADLVVRNRIADAETRLKKMFRDLLQKALRNQVQRACAYNFFLLFCGRPQEFLTEAAVDGLYRLEGGLFHDVACEAMNSLAPDPAPTTLSVDDLIGRLEND